MAALTAAALLPTACSAGEVGGPDRSDGPDADTDVQVSAADPTVEDAASAARSATLDGTVVVLDPAHNGGQFDAEDEIAHLIEPDGLTRPCNTLGAVADDGTTESSIVWAVAQDVAAKLTALGAEVVLTREDDDGVGPCVDERGELADAVDADLLLSLHADAGPVDGSGFHVVHPLPLRSRADEDALADAADLATTVRDTLTGIGLVTSDYAGEDGLAPRDDLATLNVATVPAVSVEVGNLHHAGDAQLLTSRSDQARIATALAAAIARHLGA